MGYFADQFEAANAGPLPEIPSIGGEVSKGFSRSLRGTGSALEEAAALTGERLGATDFAAKRRAEALSLRESAAQPQFAPESQDWEHVNGAGQGLRWAAGKLGEVVPAAGMAAAGTLIARNPLIGGTAAMAPIQMGDISERMNEDPQTAQQPVSQRFNRALVGGVASAGIMSAPLGGVLAKYAPKNILNAGERTLLGAGRGIAEGAATGYLGMGTGEGISQYAANPDKPLDFGAMNEAGTGGAVLVGGLHAPAAAMSYMKGKPLGMAGDALSGLKDRFDGAADATKEAAGGLGENIRATGEAAARMANGTWNAAKDRMPEGMQQHAEAAAEWISSKWQKGTEWKDELKATAEEMINDPNTPVDVKANLVRAAGNVNNKIQAGVIMTAKFAKQAWEKSEGMQDAATASADWLSKQWQKGEGWKDTLKAKADAMINDPDTPEGVKKNLVTAATMLNNKIQAGVIMTADYMKQAWKKPAETFQEVKKTVHDKVNDWTDKSSNGDAADADKIIKGMPLDDVPFFDAQGEQLTHLAAEDTKAKTQRVTEWAKSMMDDTGFDEAKRTELAEAVKNAGSVAGQHIIATAKKAWEASKEFGSNLDALSKSIGKTVDDGAKKSEDLTGFRNALQTSVIPYIAKNMPELYVRDGVQGQRMFHEENSRKLVRTLQDVMQDMSAGRMTTQGMSDLISTFGEHTMPIVERLLAATGRRVQGTDVFREGESKTEPTNGKGAMGQGNTIRGQLAHLLTSGGIEQAGLDPVVEQKMTLARLANSNASLSKIVREGMTPEAQAKYGDAKPAALVQDLLRWARGHHLGRIAGSAEGWLPEPNPKALPDSRGANVKGTAKRKTGKVTDDGLAQDAGQSEAGSTKATKSSLEHDPVMRQKFEELFGDNADVVSEAFEKEAARGYREDPTSMQATEHPWESSEKKAAESSGERESKSGGHFDADGNRVDEAQLDRVVRGGNYAFDKNGEGGINRAQFAYDKDGQLIREHGRAESVLRDPAVWERDGRKGFNKTNQLIMQMEHEFPTHDVHWEQSPGHSKGWGYVVAEREQNPERLSHADVAEMAADPKKISPSQRVVTQTPNGARLELDAKRIGWRAGKSMEYVDGEDSRTRTARAVVTGMGKVMEQFGHTDIKPETVVADGMTWAEAQEIVKRRSAGAEDRLSAEQRANLDDLEQKHTDLYERIHEAKRRLAATGEDIGIEGLQAKLGKLETSIAWAKNSEMGRDRDGSQRRPKTYSAEEQSTRLWREEELGHDLFPTDRGPTQHVADVVDKVSGQRELPLDAPIHAAVADKGEGKKLEHTSNEDGTASTDFRKFTTAENKAMNDLGGTIGKWLEGNTVAQGVGAKANEIFTYALRALSAKDRQTFLEIRKMSPGAAAEVVSKLREKYKGAIDLAGAQGLADQAVPGAKGRLEGKLPPVDRPKNPTEFKDGMVAGDRPTQNLSPAEEAAAIQSRRQKPGPTLPADANRGSAPNPKVVAAKKAALVEAATSSDPKLLKELSTTTDVKGLQRAVDALNEIKPADRVADRLSWQKDNPYRELVSRMQAALGTEMQKEVHDIKGNSVISEGLAELRAARLKGDAQAREALNAYTMTEHKSTSMLANDPLHQEVQSMLRQAKSYTVKDYMDLYQRDPAMPAVLKEIAKAISDAGGDVRVNGVDAKRLDRRNGEYDPEHNEINMWNALLRPGATMLHEAAHAVTMRALAKNHELRLAASDLMEHVLHNEPRLTQAYAMKNPLEFMAEGLSNRNFQRALEIIPPSKGVAKYLGQTVGNALQQFMNLVRRALNMPEKMTSALTQFMELSSRAMKETGADKTKGVTGAEFNEMMARQHEDNVRRAIDVANERLGKLIEEDPQNAYDLQTKKYSMGGNAGGPHGPVLEAEMQRLAKQMLDRVELKIEGMPHAGDFMRDSARRMDVLRVSTTAFDPLGTLHHEALHAFFGHLRHEMMGDVAQVLEKYSASAHIMDQLRVRLKDAPEALAQLRDPEERAAYMFQFYKTDPTFKLAPTTRNLFGRISDFFHNIMGVWTNNERATHIMDYFQRGDFAKDMGNMNVVHDKLMKEGRNAALVAAKKWTEPMGRLGDAMVGMGAERLRDTGIPALNKIADLVKTNGRGQGGDRGYAPAAREVRSVMLNKYAEEMKNYTPQEHREALEALQNGVQATGRALAAQRITERTLDLMFDHMKAKGVDIGKLHDITGAHYVPRVWDAAYIAKNKDAFLNMMEKYTRSGQFAGDPMDMMRNIMSNDGSSFNVVTRQPGMQFKKERLLKFIDHADAAPFLQKDLMVMMDNYITQGARRAEWAERFGDDASKMEKLFQQAREQGATNEQIVTAETFLKGTAGTLGDEIDPNLRRIQGNAIIYQNIRLLPLALFSSLVDPMGIAVRGGTMKQAFGAFITGFKEIPQGFKKLENRTKSHNESTAELMGVIDNAFLHSSLGALYNQGMVGDFGRNLNDTFFKYNLMEQYNRSMRSAATGAAIKFIETHADGTASKHSARWMQELGLNLDKSDFKADGSLKLYESDGLSAEKATRMRQAVNQWVDGAVLRPDAVDKPIWMNDPHFALVAHLKQFTFSFQETILKRVMHEYQHGNSGPALALASYVPMMIAADMAKGMIQGGGSQPSWKQDWDMSDYVASGIQRAGLLGVGQYGLDAVNSVRQGGTGLGVLSGPTFEQLGDAVSTLGGRKSFSSFALHSLPANAVYADWVQHPGAGGSGADKPYEPIAAE